MVRWTWRVKLLTHLQSDLLAQLRERAEREAIDVFATKVSHISGFTAMGPVTDYRKFHLATWKYGNWESGPWAEHFPTGLE